MSIKYLYETGKSTLFRTLSSVNDSLPKNGSATILGYNVVSASWSIGDQQLVGYVPQEGGLFGFMSVREVLDLFKSFSRYVVCPAQSELSVIDEKYLSYPIRALSGGNKKKLSILLSNMHSPRALLLDECTTGIDPHAAERVLDYLSKNVTDQQGLLFASHRVEECVTVCDKIIVMCDGQIALDGPIHKFYEMASEFYLVDIGILNQNQSIPVANSFIDLIIGQLSSRLSTDLAAADLAESLFISTVVYCPTLVRVMCRKTDAPLSTMWTLLEELMIAKRIKNYYFRDVGMEEVLAVLISQSTVALDH